MLELKVRRIGGSLGVLLPKPDLDALGIREGATVFVPRLQTASRRKLYGVWRRQPVRLEFEEG